MSKWFFLLRKIFSLWEDDPSHSWTGDNWKKGCKMPLNTNELLRQIATEITDAIATSNLAIMQRLDKLERKIMSTADDIITDVQAEATLIAGLSTAIGSLKQKLADALSGVNIPADVQAKIDQAFDGLEANKTALAKALTTASDTTTPVPDVPAPPAPDAGGTTDQPTS